MTTDELSMTERNEVWIGKEGVKFITFRHLSIDLFVNFFSSRHQCRILFVGHQFGGSFRMIDTLELFSKAGGTEVSIWCISGDEQWRAADETNIFAKGVCNRRIKGGACF